MELLSPQVTPSRGWILGLSVVFFCILSDVRAVWRERLLHAEDEMEKQNAIALVDAFWRDVWQACNPAAVDRYVTEDFVITSAGAEIVGRERFKAWVAEFQTRVSGLEFDIIETFQNADGSRVASRWRIRGRNNGMLGSRPDQRPIAFTGTAVWAVTPDGRLAHNWVERSAWELSKQLGVG
jgi:ketosteroid isomerase-like protein